jgi:hypothetical protein
LCVCSQRLHRRPRLVIAPCKHIITLQLTLVVSLAPEPSPAPTPMYRSSLTLTHSPTNNNTNYNRIVQHLRQRRSQPERRVSPTQRAARVPTCCCDQRACSRRVSGARTASATRACVARTLASSIRVRRCLVVASTRWTRVRRSRRRLRLV